MKTIHPYFIFPLNFLLTARALVTGTFAAFLGIPLFSQAGEVILYKPFRTSLGTHYTLQFASPNSHSKLTISIDNKVIKLETEGVFNGKQFADSEWLIERRRIADFVVAKQNNQFVLFFISEDFVLYSMDLEGTWRPATSWIGRFEKRTDRKHESIIVKTLPNFLRGHSWQDEQGNLFTYARTLSKSSHGPNPSCENILR
jgi:hypothetical protein